MNVKIARIKMGLTQKQLRDKLVNEFSVGISPSTIVAIEKGNYSTLNFGQMVAIAAALNSTVPALFFSDED
ncbi:MULTISPECIES: helix-turn-helix transcriptional regulator [unclassified Clostridium]|uniref:helix-turn-helix transcriptional regulator n=1 Tax=unclassified Clostridium TaxID=2614128 RepID=UPI003217D398